MPQIHNIRMRVLHFHIDPYIFYPLGFPEKETGISYALHNQHGIPIMQHPHEIIIGNCSLKRIPCIPATYRPSRDGHCFPDNYRIPGDCPKCYDCRTLRLGYSG